MVATFRVFSISVLTFESSGYSSNNKSKKAKEGKTTAVHPLPRDHPLQESTFTTILSHSQNSLQSPGRITALAQPHIPPY